MLKFNEFQDHITELTSSLKNEARKALENHIAKKKHNAENRRASQLIFQSRLRGSVKIDNFQFSSFPKKSLGDGMSYEKRDMFITINESNKSSSVDDFIDGTAPNNVLPNTATNKKYASTSKNQNYSQKGKLFSHFERQQFLDELLTDIQSTKNGFKIAAL